jgi:hypothetical protein
VMIRALRTTAAGAGELDKPIDPLFSFDLI